jgi:hypothetical protein
VVIVRVESRLEIEAMVSNPDIGFVDVGQEAAIEAADLRRSRLARPHPHADRGQARKLLRYDRHEAKLRRANVF